MRAAWIVMTLAIFPGGLLGDETQAAPALTSTLLSESPADARLIYHIAECDGPEVVECETVSFACPDQTFSMNVAGLSEGDVSAWFKRGPSATTTFGNKKSIKWAASELAFSELDGAWTASLAPEEASPADFIALTKQATQLTVNGPAKPIVLPLTPKDQANFAKLGKACIQ